jgi:hypothetical protein
MIYKLKFLITVICSLCLYPKSQAQEPGNFYYLYLPKATILNALGNTHFAEFAFRLWTSNSSSPKYYTLQCIEIDDDEDVISPPGAFLLNTVSGLAAKFLYNHFRGVFVLTKDMMNQSQIDGSSNLYFSPRQFTSNSGKIKKFITYLLDYKTYPSLKRQMKLPAPVPLNPSPPRNSK